MDTGTGKLEAGNGWGVFSDPPVGSFPCVADGGLQLWRKQGAFLHQEEM